MRALERTRTSRLREGRSRESRSREIAPRLTRELGPQLDPTPLADELREETAADWADGEMSRLFKGARYLLIGFVAIFAAWSALAPINGAVVAPASINFLSEQQIIQHREGGIVRGIGATEGELVSEGDILLKLDKTETSAQVARLETQLAEAEATQRRLVAERDQDVLLQASDDNASEVGQERLLAARERNREVSVRILQERERQTSARLEGLREQLGSAERRQELQKSELEEMQPLYDKGLITRSRMHDVEDTLVAIGGEVARIRHEIEETEAQRREISLTIAQTQTSLVESIEGELREVETRIADLQQQLLTARDALNRTDIKAPRSGRVLGLNVHTIGAVVQPGEKLMAIVPVDDKIYVSAQLAPQDVDQVRIGDEVRLRITVLDTPTPPRLEGRVTSVSADTLVDEASRRPYYLLRIEIVEYDGLDRSQLVSGTPVEAYIETGGRSLLSYLLRPLLNAFSSGLA